MSYSHDLRFTAFASATLAIVLSIEVYAQEPWSARPEVVAKFESRRRPFNYDEQKVPVYTLPDPLVTSDGSKIATADDWNQTRRGELMELFRSHVYGRRPDVEYAVQFKQTEVL